MEQTENQGKDLRLIFRIREGDRQAKEDLVEKYIPLIRHIIRNYYSSFLEYEDLLQEGFIGLLNAIDEYKPEKFEVKFSSFAYICIIRRIYNIIKVTSGNKHRALNDAVSLYTFINQEGSLTIIDLIPDSDSPLEEVEELLMTKELHGVLKNYLSLFEYAVCSLMLKGYSSREIELELQVGSKAVDNARTRMKTKLRKVIKEQGSLTEQKTPLKVRQRRDLYLETPRIQMSLLS